MPSQDLGCRQGAGQVLALHAVVAQDRGVDVHVDDDPLALDADM